MTAVSSIANGGNLVQPRVVQKIINSETGEINEIEPIIKNQAISKETSSAVLSMMGSVVEERNRKKWTGEGL